MASVKTGILMPTQKIIGYRDLNAQEVALINRIKAHGELTERLFGDVLDHLSAQIKAAGETGTPTEMARIKRAQPERWCSIARTHFQEGLTALVRAVAQPSSF